MLKQIVILLLIGLISPLFSQIILSGPRKRNSNSGTVLGCDK